MGTQFFTQEYEGRETDISLIPWGSHRSLWSAMFSLIKNPTPEEFKVWVKAAERETWRYAIFFYLLHIYTILITNVTNIYFIDTSRESKVTAQKNGP